MKRVSGLIGLCTLALMVAFGADAAAQATPTISFIDTPCSGTFSFSVESETPVEIVASVYVVPPAGGVGDSLAGGSFTADIGTDTYSVAVPATDAPVIGFEVSVRDAGGEILVSDTTTADCGSRLTDDAPVESLAVDGPLVTDLAIDCSGVVTFTYPETFPALNVAIWNTAGGPIIDERLYDPAAPIAGPVTIDFATPPNVHEQLGVRVTEVGSDAAAVVAYTPLCPIDDETLPSLTTVTGSCDGLVSLAFDTSTITDGTTVSVTVLLTRESGESLYVDPSQSFNLVGGQADYTLMFDPTGWETYDLVTVLVGATDPRTSANVEIGRSGFTCLDEEPAPSPTATATSTATEPPAGLTPTVPAGDTPTVPSGSNNASSTTGPGSGPASTGLAVTSLPSTGSGSAYTSSLVAFALTVISIALVALAARAHRASSDR